MTFTPGEIEYLRSQHVGRLATVSSDGVLQNNPTSFRVNPDSGTIDIGGMMLGKTKKYRNVLEGNTSVAVVVDEVTSLDPYTFRGIEVRGKAEALTDQEPIHPAQSRDLIRIHPTRIISWGIDNDQFDIRGRDV